MRLLKISIIFFSLFTIILPACNNSKKPDKSEEPELLIYCGITMIKPMTDIKKIIEKQEHCRIIITKGGSGNLLNAILENKIGDLYLPGSDVYYKTIRAKAPDLITDSVFVGFNKAAMMVQKGNPKHITADLDNLTKKDYAVVIGNPESGSIGRQTRKILERKGIYQQVKENAWMLTTDSKDLVNVLRDNKADLVVNWFATSTWPENRDFVDVLPIASEYAKKNRLVLGLLKYSKNPEIAKKFLNFASSDKGREFFRLYGLLDVQ